MDTDESQFELEPIEWMPLSPKSVRVLTRQLKREIPRNDHPLSGVEFMMHRQERLNRRCPARAALDPQVDDLSHDLVEDARAHALARHRDRRRPCEHFEGTLTHPLAGSIASSSTAPQPIAASRIKPNATTTAICAEFFQTRSMCSQRTAMYALQVKHTSGTSSSHS